ncbi:MAG: hypothetical protein JO061_20365, partial [Acidobacteriaceae bacterium]|nr:hypothetical protein [Acidobacteriaceae bacterium]
NQLSTIEQDSPALEQTTRNAALPISALLSKALLLFALEFERDSKLSLAISANVLRLLNDGPVRVQDLPRLSGVSKELIAVALGFLEKRGYASVKPESSTSRVKVVTLTANGQHGGNAYHHKIQAIEEDWMARFGGDAIDRLRGVLQRLVGDGTASKSPLFDGLNPYPDGWRASRARPETLPHYPMVSHRGGFPDGS